MSFADLLRTQAVRGRTGNLLVRATDPEVVRAVAGVGGVAVMRGGLLRVTPAAGTDDLALARTLHGTPGVAWVNPDLLLALETSAVVDDPGFPNQWHLDNTGQGGRSVDVDINAPVAWGYASGAGQRIAIIDSGTELTHPDLRVVAGHDYIDRDDDPSPDATSSGPHGTACAGVAAATGNNGYGVAGVAWGAEVYAIRLIGGNTSLDDLYNSFVESVDAGAGVLSNSWGFGQGCEGIENYSTFGEMFDYAEDVGRDGLGSVVVFAAGNGGCDVEADGMLNHRKLVVVAAVEWNDVRAGYSSYGDAVDIAAPTSLLTTDMSVGGYGSYGGDDAFADGFAGTSASTPVVAGVVALMMEANPRISAAQIRRVLCATAVRNDVAGAGYDDEGWSPYYGCGRIDAGAAVAAVANGPPEAPVPILTRDAVAPDRALLAWAPAADPDDDVVAYDVVWWRADEDESAVDPVEVIGTTWDIAEALSVGDTVSWKVRAVDPWGEGPWSVTTTFVVDPAATPPEESPAAPPPASGCATAPGAAPTGALVGLLLLTVCLRRRCTPC